VHRFASALVKSLSSTPRWGLLSCRRLLSGGLFSAEERERLSDPSPGKGDAMSLLIAVALIVAATGYPLLTIVRKSPKKKLLPIRYLLPEGYIGWVRVEYSIDRALPLPVEAAHCVVKIPESGVLVTSSKLDYTRVVDDYYYYSDRERRPLPSNSCDGSSMIWGEAMLVTQDAGSAQACSYRTFFVGTRSQYRKRVANLGQAGNLRLASTAPLPVLRSSLFMNLAGSVAQCV